MLKKYNYFCKVSSSSPTCSTCDKGGMIVVESHDGQEEELICPSDCKTVLKRLGEVVFGKFGPKLTSSEIKKDRKGRSQVDFKKNVLPKLDEGSAEQKHFKRKYKQKL